MQSFPSNIFSERLPDYLCAIDPKAVESAGKSESQAREEWVGLESLYKVRRAKARWLTAVATKGQELFDKLSHQAANVRQAGSDSLHTSNYRYPIGDNGTTPAAPSVLAQGKTDP